MALKKFAKSYSNCNDSFLGENSEGIPVGNDVVSAPVNGAIRQNSIITYALAQALGMNDDGGTYEVNYNTEYDTVVTKLANALNNKISTSGVDGLNVTAISAATDLWNNAWTPLAGKNFEFTISSASALNINGLTIPAYSKGFWVGVSSNPSDKVVTYTDTQGKFHSAFFNSGSASPGWHETPYVVANNNITGATKCKITYDAKGLVTAGADLTENDVPELSTSKITNLNGKLSGTYTVGESMYSLSTYYAPGQFIQTSLVDGYEGHVTFAKSFQNGTIPRVYLTSNSTAGYQVRAINISATGFDYFVYSGGSDSRCSYLAIGLR